MLEIKGGEVSIAPWRAVRGGQMTPLGRFSTSDGDSRVHQALEMEDFQSTIRMRLRL